MPNILPGNEGTFNGENWAPRPPVRIEGYRIEWSFHQGPDLTIEVWSTAALLGAVIEALLEEPDKLKLALEALQKSKPG